MLLLLFCEKLVLLLQKQAVVLDVLGKIEPVLFRLQVFFLLGGKRICFLDFHVEVTLDKGKQEIVVFEVGEFLGYPIAQLPYLKP